jgi:hypothetical protein
MPMLGPGPRKPIRIHPGKEALVSTIKLRVNQARIVNTSSPHWRLLKESVFRLGGAPTNRYKNANFNLFWTARRED